MLEQGPDFWCWFDTTPFSYIPLCSPNTCKYVFNPNVTTFQSNCAEGLHFSTFIFLLIYTVVLLLINILLNALMKIQPVLERGSTDKPLTFEIDLIQLSFIPVCSPNTCKLSGGFAL